MPAAPVDHSTARRRRATDEPSGAAGRSPTTGAFTLIELLVVLAVIAGLAAMVLPALLASAENSRIKATQATVDEVATMIDSHAAGNGLMLTAAGRRRYRWDFDFDPNETDNQHLLDGYPERVFAEQTLIDAAEAAGYRGFYGTLGGTWGEANLDLETGEITDNWGQVLRIKFDKATYGTHGFGIYSVGPDGIDGSDDDIRSWGREK